MAEKKKTATKAAGKVTTAKVRQTVAVSTSADACDAYKALRNVLDGVQFKALEYYTEGRSDDEKVRRSAVLRDILLVAYHEMEKLSSLVKGEDNCPPENRCNGVCLPYGCP